MCTSLIKAIECFDMALQSCPCMQPDVVPVHPQPHHTADHLVCAGRKDGVSRPHEH